MTRYFDKRKKQKLYQQWVDESGLPAESVPEDLDEKSTFDEAIDEDSGIRRPSSPSGLSIRLTMRHLFYLMLIIAILLITTASLATTLIIQSC
jgi:hypothetical protein